MQPDHDRAGRRGNPVYWLIWLLPLAAVAASFTTLAIAMRAGDRALPETYHWEGAGLDRDFARMRVAADRGFEVTFDLRGHSCVAQVSPAPGDAAALELQLTSASDAARDRSVRFERVAPGEYRARCDVPSVGRWYASVGDAAGSWIIRARVTGPLGEFTMRARDPGASP